MNEALLNASADYQRLLRYFNNVQERCEKASKLKIDGESKYFRAYSEICFRHNALKDTLLYIEEMSSKLSYPDCVSSASEFIMNVMNRYPDCDEDYSELLGAALKLPDCKLKMDEFCNSMNVFTDYEVTSEELLFKQSVKMIASGIDLLLAIREHICPVNKNCSTCAYFISYTGR